MIAERVRVALVHAWGALKKVAWFLIGAVRDPHSLDASSSRLCGVVLVVAGVGIAVYGALHNHEHAATVATLTTTGTGMIAARTKSVPGGES